MSRLWIVGVLACVIGGIAIFSNTHDARREEEDPTNLVDAQALAASGMMNTPWIMPPIDSPIMLTAEEAALDDDDEVIGVLLPSGPRAYSISAMSTIGTHVVNEHDSGTSVTVTYCDLNNCTRVFTKSDTTEELDMYVCGRKGDEMLIMVNGVAHAQSSEEIPFDEFEYVRTDWKSWLAEHPDTLVFVGIDPPRAEGESEEEAEEVTQPDAESPTHAI